MKKKITFLLLFLCTCLTVLFNIESKTTVVNAATPSTDEYNIVSYDAITKETSFLYYDDSIWSAEENPIEILNEGISPATIIPDGDDWYTISDTTIFPYKYIAKLKQGASINIGSAFFIGQNILFTAGHCVYDLNGFEQNLRIYPGQNGNLYPYGYFNVKKIYIEMEYYLDCGIDYDWAILVIDSTENTGTHPGGNLGKIANYSRTDERLYVLGYPGTGTGLLYEAPGNRVEPFDNPERIEYTCDAIGGSSGGAVVVNRNGNYYAVGIHTAGANTNGGTKIDSLLYLLTNSLLVENSIEVKDFYLNRYKNSDGKYVLEEIKYNCVGKIIVNPGDNKNIYVSANGTTYNGIYLNFSEEFYPSGSNTTRTQIPFDYFKILDRSTNTYSSPKQLSMSFSLDELSATYATVARSDYTATIDTSFDQSANIWYHYGSKNQTIKGTIVYQNEARNIEVVIPGSSTKTSTTVTINGVTFQLRCGKNRVSIKASSTVQCDVTNTFFAFGVA